VPGSSHALPLAERLGFPAPVLERARTLRPQGAQELEQLMAELADATLQIRAERERLTAARQAAEREAATHREATEETRKELAAMRKQLTRESEVLLGRARELWQTLQREAKRGEKTRARSDELRREMAALERETDELAQQATGTEGPHARPAAILPGVRVKVLDLGVEAEVVSGPDDEGRVQLRRGNWSIQSHVGRLAEAVSAPPAEKAAAGVWSIPEAMPLEVDLRGMEASDAVTELDQGIDRAVLAGLTELRVIHGVGRGILRAAVEKHLRGHPQVASQRPGEVGEGGRGVTVAKLR
jgi:DNA mismatch repair protein MutS2